MRNSGVFADGIRWEQAKDITSDADVRMDGVLRYAYSWQAHTVNGVSFSAGMTGHSANLNNIPENTATLADITLSASSGRCVMYDYTFSGFPPAASENYKSILSCFCYANEKMRGCMIGCPFICPDLVGGGSYASFLKGSKFDQELFVRYAQIAALSPMMQISASPWRLLDERHQKLFKEAVALRQKFAPKIVSLVRQAGRDGEPILRNLEYNFPAMGYADIKDEFMLGTDILVAPVVVKGQTDRTVQLPPGCWCGDDGREYAGPVKITISTPLERLPYFTKLPQFIK